MFLVCLSPLAPFLFRFIQHITLSQSLPSSFVPFCAILSVYFLPFRIGTYYRSSSDFHHLVSAHLLIVSRFGLPARGSLPNGHSLLHLVGFFTTLCLSFTGPYHRSSYTCSQPATGYTAHLINCTSVQPCPTTTCSSFSSVCLPTSSLFQFARRPTALLVLNPTSHQHKHTSI